MSTMATPSGDRRGMSVPGIDASSHAINSFDQGWPVTLPQSAIPNDSRRPSLAYSSLSEVSHSRPSWICDYSQPSTATSAMHHGQVLQHHWSDGQVSIPNDLPQARSQRQTLQPMSSASFSHQPVPAYLTVDAFGQLAATAPPRSPSHQVPPQYQNTDQPGMSTTLFPTTQTLAHDPQSTTSFFANPNLSMPTPMHPSLLTSTYDTTSAAVYASIYPPSQVIPLDDYAEEGLSSYNDYGTGNGVAHSLDSSVSSNSAWEMIGQLSPADSNFVNVRDNLSISPIRSPEVSGGHYYPSPESSRSRRRSSRRARKSNRDDKAWFEGESHNIQVRYAGKRFWFDNDSPSGSFTIVPEESKDCKPYKCRHPDLATGKICGSSFARAEHLRRHEGSHSSIRKYHCPLKKCDKKISRLDNACDHFKTHLRKTARGRRNHICSFEDLEQGILAGYEGNVAAKLLQNLRKWTVAEQERKRSEAEEGKGKEVKSML